MPADSIHPSFLNLRSIIESATVEAIHETNGGLIKHPAVQGSITTKIATPINQLIKLTREILNVREIRLFPARHALITKVSMANAVHTDGIRIGHASWVVNLL